MKPNACDEYIQKLAQELPELCTVNDLIKARIFSSPSTVRDSRASGNSPPYFQTTRRGKILYPRNGVIEWLKEKIHGCISKAP